MTTLFWGIEFFASFIQAFMCFLFCGTFLIKEDIAFYKYKMIIMAFLSACIVIAFNTIVLFSSLNTFMFLLIFWLFQWIVFRKRIAFSFLLTVVYFAILVCLDFSTTYVVSAIGGVDTVRLMSEQSVVRIYNIFLSISLLSILIITINRFLKKSSILPKSHIALMFLCSAFLQISSFIMVDIDAQNRGKTSAFSMVFFFASLIIVLLLFLLIIKLAGKYEQLKKNESY